MPLDYQQVWESMNSLEQLSAKIISAREILDASRYSLECRDSSKTEALIIAAQEFLDFYLNEFDEKFKVAWNETVVKCKDDGFYWDTDTKGNVIDWTSQPSFSYDCMDNFAVDYTKSPLTNDFDSLTKRMWKLPVEHILNEKGQDEYFITLSDDLLEQTGWVEDTELIWEDNGDGSYTLRKP